MPGLRFKLWPIFKVERFPWVQVAPDHIGLVIAQVGQPLPTGAKSAVYRARVRQLRRHRDVPVRGRPARRAATGPAPRHDRADPPGRVHRITGDEVFGKVVSETTLTAVSQVDPALPRHAHHPSGRPRHRRRGDHARGSAVRRHREPDRRLQRRHHHGVDRRGLGQPDHPGGAAGEEPPPRQLPGLPGVPRQRRLHRAPARPAAVRLVPHQPVPRERRAARDARGAPGRGRGDQVLRRPPHRGHIG